jgi:hypothetical protein
VYVECTCLDISVGLNVLVVVIACGPSVEQLYTADLDNSVAFFGVESGRFGVEYDLTHD